MTSNVVDESMYQCEICLVIDNQDKVCCDLCQLWYHFKCVNVTADVADKHWACMKCEGSHQQQSTPNRSNVTNISNPVVTLANYEENKLPGAVGPVFQNSDTSVQVTGEQISPVQTINIQSSKGQSTANTVNTTTDTRVDKPSKSQKTVSISSSVSRRTALALQRLEEEKQLCEKRELEDKERRDRNEREYLDKKYSLLENDSDSVISLFDEELEELKRDRTVQWSKETVKVNHPVARIKSC